MTGVRRAATAAAARDTFVRWCHVGPVVPCMPPRRAPTRPPRRRPWKGSGGERVRVACPRRLLFAVVVLALLAGYLWVQRLRHRHVLRFTNLALLDMVAPARPNASRHAPTALVLIGLLVLAVVMAGRSAAKKVPRNRAR